jgi:hypothetical protein
MKGEHGGDGIAGEAEEMRATDAARGEGTPRLHRHLPEVDAARLLEHRLDEIVVAHRDAPGGQDHVGVLGGAEEADVELVELVRHDAVVHRLRARRLHQAAQGEAIGVEDLPGFADGPRLGDLVARREDGHARPLPHEELGETERGGHPDLLRAEHAPRRQHDGAGPDILATEPDIRSRRHRPHDHPVAPPLDVLLEIHGIRPGRHGCARHDAKRLIPPGGPREDRSRGELARHDELACACGGNVRARHRVAIDGRIGGGRHIRLGANVFGEDTAEGGGERQELRRGDGDDAIQDMRLSVPHRDHARIIAPPLRGGRRQLC